MLGRGVCRGRRLAASLQGKCFSVNIKEKVPLRVRSLTSGFPVEPVIWGLTRAPEKVKQDALHVSMLFRGLPAPRLSYTGPTEGWACFVSWINYI